MALEVEMLQGSHPEHTARFVSVAPGNYAVYLKGLGYARDGNGGLYAFDMGAYMDDTPTEPDMGIPFFGWGADLDVNVFLDDTGDEDEDGGSGEVQEDDFDATATDFETNVGPDASGDRSYEIQEDNFDGSARDQAITEFLFGPSRPEAEDDVDEPGGPGEETSGAAIERRQAQAMSRMEHALHEAFDELQRAVGDPDREGAKRRFQAFVFDQFLRDGMARNPTFNQAAASVLLEIGREAFDDPGIVEDRRRQFFEARGQVAVAAGALSFAVPAVRATGAVGSMLLSALRFAIRGRGRGESGQPFQEPGGDQLQPPPVHETQPEFEPLDETADTGITTDVAELRRRVEKEVRRPDYADVHSISPVKINKEFVDRAKSNPKRNPDDPEPHPPHRPDVPAFKVMIGSPEGTEYVRYIGKKSKAEGRWVMRAEEVEGLSLAQIKDKFALEIEPHSLVRVRLPKGTELLGSAANPHPEWGRGNGIQFQIQGELNQDWFSTPEIIK